MNKKEKKELGQNLIDLIYEVDGQIDTFLEEYIDWKYVKENIDVKNLKRGYKIDYPTWSVFIQRDFYPPDDVYMDFGVMKNEQLDFNGDGIDFKKWIKNNMSDTSIGRFI